MIVIPRLLLYTCLVFLVVLGVIHKKNLIIASWDKEIVSMISEKQKHGIAVDVEFITVDDFSFFTKCTARVSSIRGGLESQVTRQTQQLIRVGQKFTATIGEAVFTGRVSYVEQTPNIENGLFNIRFVVNQSLERHREFNFPIQIETKTYRNVIALPNDAVLKNETGTFVYILDDNNDKAILNPVSTGESNEYETIITKGLKPQTYVIVSGQKTLRDGDLVRIYECFNCKCPNC